MQRFSDRLLCLSLLGPALVAASPVLAQDDVVVLEPIILTATGLPVEIMESPAAITVITADEIARGTPVTIAALLEDVPGVQVFEEGIERIAIRGEESRRVAILIDGQKLTDHTDYGQPVLVDPTTIERIELLRGASSVVSGSRAIGGVINIVTKRGADKPFALTTMAGYFSATRGYRVSATAAGTISAGAGEMDYRISAGQMEQGDRRTPDRILRPSDVNDRNLSGHLGYRQGPHYFGLKAQAYDLGANIWIGEDDFALSLPRRDLRKIAGFYEGTALTPWLDRLTVDVYRQSVAREFWTEFGVANGPMRVGVRAESDDKQRTTGLNMRAEMRFSPNSRTLAGLEIENDRLETDKLTTTTVTMMGRPLSERIVERNDTARIRTVSVFGQHEISLNDQWTATFGARWYDVEAKHLSSRTNGAVNPTTTNSDSLLMGTAGLVWSPDATLAVRANLSQGYIYPTLNQLFMTNASGSEGLVEGNPNLKPETSTTIELGARYDNGATLIDATLFRTEARDYIARVSTAPRLFSYDNVDRARATGIELHAEHFIEAASITPYATVTAMRRKLEFADGFSTYDSGTPAFAGRIGVRRDWQAGALSGRLDLFLRGESGAELRTASGAIDESASGWATLNLRGDVEFGNGLQAVAEIVNLTNRSYQPYDKMPGAERSINLFLTRSF